MVLIYAVIDIPMPLLIAAASVAVKWGVIKSTLYICKGTEHDFFILQQLFNAPY